MESSDVKILQRRLEKALTRPRSRQRERLLRKYGTDIPIIKAMILLSDGLSIALDIQGTIKEIKIPLIESIPDYEILFKKRKLRHLFHEESLLVDVYTLGEGVLFTIELEPYIFDELL